MQVSDVLDDARKIFGTSDKEVIYRRLSDAVTLISNESEWDSLIGYMTVSVGSDGLVTLPYDVDRPLAVNVDGFPTFPRSKWFEYHLNGPGEYSHMDYYKKFYDDKGLAPIIKTITEPFFPELSSTEAADNALSVRIYGKDEDGNSLSHTDGTKGILVQIGTTSTTKVSDISAVFKPITAGKVSMKSGADLYGEYQTFEEEPNYKRIKVPANSSITMMYRRRIGEIKSDYDYIFMNRLSLIAACRSVRYRETDRIQDALAQQQDAIYHASKEQERRNINDSIGFQTVNFATDWNESLYNDDFSSGGGCY